MSILYNVLIVAIFCLAPAGVLWLCRRFPLLDKIGPVMILYALGMLIGNLPFLDGWLTADWLSVDSFGNKQTVANPVTTAMIPLAIPMMLFGCRFTRKDASLQIRTVISGFLSVAIAVVVGYIFFGKHKIE